MVKKFTIDEFKLTFNKPALPKGLAGKKKDGLEDVVKELAKGDSRNADDFTKNAAEIFKDHPDYYVDLLSYKMAKHWDGKERKTWLEKSPPEAQGKVLDKLYGSKTMDEDAINEELKNAGSAVIPKYLGEKYPEVVKSAAKKKFKELKGKELEEYGRSLPFDAKKEFLVDALKSKDANAVQACGGAFPFLPLKDQMELADADPVFFVANIFLPSHDSTDNALNMLKNPKWRDILQKDPVAWKKLTDTMPVLSVGEAAKKRVGKDDATPQELTEAIFDCVCQNDGVEMTYFTNPIDSDHALLGGPGETDNKAKEEQVAHLKSEGYDLPDKPATQCHNLKGVVKQMVLQTLGDKVKIEEDHIENMLLTKPISGMPGGLLPNTFGGNVYDENDRLTGQAMFTGVGGKHSHTWLRIDGVDFDPVLGTKGPAVKAAKADEFTWIVSDLVGKGTKGDFIIKDPKLKAAPNKNGFGSAYRLTTDPTKYIQGVYGLTFETADTDVKVKTVADDGPSKDILEAGDVVLKVDGALVDASQFYEYSIGNDGQKRVFEIRRGKKKKKLSVKAVSPIKTGV
jgi:hypothetical protein